jgi:uncharacterized protein (DUF1810 family)
MSGNHDRYALQRFVDAQDRVYDTVLAELRNGAKRSHWIWFVFPQLRGLGRSATAQHYGISSLEEARAYLAHPVLGPRLRDCTRLVAATDDNGDFRAVLDKFYAGEDDPATVELLRTEQ